MLHQFSLEWYFCLPKRDNPLNLPHYTLCCTYTVHRKIEVVREMSHLHKTYNNFKKKQNCTVYYSYWFQIISKNVFSLLGFFFHPFVLLFCCKKFIFQAKNTVQFSTVLLYPRNFNENYNKCHWKKKKYLLTVFFRLFSPLPLLPLSTVCLKEISILKFVCSLSP